MATNARALSANTAARMSRSKSEESTGSLRLYLEAIRPYSAILAALFLFVAIVVFKGHLIALVDHEISSISVSGELKKVTPDQVSGKISPWLNTSFLTADLNEIKRQVDSLPWVKSATVSRVWPGQIAVGTTEQKPTAKWNGVQYINAEGELFKPGALDWEQFLPGLVGPETSNIASRAEMLQRLAELNALLSPHHLSAQVLEMKSRGVWELTLSDGIRVALGAPPFEEKVERLAMVLAGASEDNKTRMLSIDTRYPNGLAIEWKEESEAVKAAQPH